MALKAEEIGMVYFYAGGVDASVSADLKNSGNITLSQIQDTSNPIVLVFNNDKSPVNSLPVRKAIAKGIDYTKCRELFGSEYSVPSNYGFIPKSNEGYVDTPELKLDIESAKKLLSDAGAVDSDGDGILEINGAPLNLEILVRTDKPIYARVGELLQTNLKAIGINVILNSVDVPTFRAMTETEHSDVSMLSRFTAFGMNMGAGMSTSYLDGRLKTNAQGQVMDPAFASIVDELKAAKSMDDYDKAAKKCQEYYADNVPAIALYWDIYLQAYNSKYDNFTIDGTFGIVNQQTWYSITQK
jgi:peptide/nickel transport system substrate-binding protein